MSIMNYELIKWMVKEITSVLLKSLVVATIPVLLVWFLFLALSNHSKSHEATKVQGFATWKYDKECCSDKDCAPVIKFERVQRKNDLIPGGVEYGWKYTTKYGVSQPVWDTQNVTIKPSGDNMTHACILLDPEANGYVTCLYKPNAT